MRGSVHELVKILVSPPPLVLKPHARNRTGQRGKKTPNRGVHEEAVPHPSNRDKDTHTQNQI